MSTKTAIPWTDSTFNIAWGCTKISPGCANCYAADLAPRFGFKVWGDSPRRTFGAKHWNEPRRWNKEAEKAGIRRRVFGCSMCDWAEDHPAIAAELPKFWTLIRETPWLTWQLCTKRAGRIAQCLPDDWGDGYPNVWMGATAENQEMADLRAIQLMSVAARVRWLSIEPMLTPISLDAIFMIGDFHNRPIDWVVVGGESGRKARQMDVPWARAVLEQCCDARVAFFFKQGSEANWVDFKNFDAFPPDLRVREFPREEGGK